MFHILLEQGFSKQFPNEVFLENQKILKHCIVRFLQSVHIRNLAVYQYGTRRYYITVNHALIDKKKKAV